MEIKIKIEAPGLEAAITALAEAFSNVPVTQKPAVEVKEAPKKEKTAKKADKPKKETKKAEPEPDAAEEETTEEESTGLTFEQVRVKLAEVSQKGKQKELKDLITSFGVAKLSDIPEEKYAELLEKAAEL